MGKIFQCPECCEQALYESQIKKHIQRMHSEDIECPLCCRAYSRLDNLRRHYACHVSHGFSTLVLDRAIQKRVRQKSYMEIDTRNTACPCTEKTFNCLMYSTTVPFESWCGYYRVVGDLELARGF